ncbi:MAG TPA: hypothetical protein VIQ24_00325 [Pyrinomonadaceae bacterium]
MKWKSPLFLASARRFIFVAALGLLLVGLTPQPLYAQAFDRIERAQTMLNAIKGELKKNYDDPTFRGMDVDARFKVAEEKIKQATTLGQAFGAIAQALLDLNDSHTFSRPTSRPVSVEYGWQMQAIGNECYVSAVKPGSDANDYIRESEDSDRLQRHRFHKFGGVVAWKLDSFSFVPEQAEVIMNGQIAGSNALILDLRGNLGGYVVTLN